MNGIPDSIALRQELECALHAAQEAGNLLMDYLHRVTKESKDDGEWVSEADRAADDCLRGIISKGFPDDALLTEETPDDRSRLEADRVWIIDPLDGTREYLTGIDEWALHIALAVDGQPELGVIHRPSREETWVGIPGCGAFKRTGAGNKFEPCICDDDGQDVRVVLSRRDLGEVGKRWLSHLPVQEEVRCGGSGLKAMLVAEGNCQVYGALTPKMKEWDTCAPHAIVVAAGAHCLDLAGRPLRYNRSDIHADQGFLVVSKGSYARLEERLKAAARDVPWLAR